MNDLVTTYTATAPGILTLRRIQNIPERIRNAQQESPLCSTTYWGVKYPVLKTHFFKSPPALKTIYFIPQRT